MIKEINVNSIEPITKINLTNKIKELEGLNHIIAHNLRGAGANIKMLADILMRKQSLEVDSEVIAEDDVFTEVEAIQYIQDCSNSLLNTLNTLMEVGNIQLSTNIKYDSCDIEAIVSQIVDQLHGFVHQKKATIEFDLSQQLSYPQPYMESILYNFINNALKYSRPDVPLKIIISTRVQNGKNVLSVKDNGQGIDLVAHGKRIFKLNQVFHTGYESKGIGLYITKTQIESMGGCVSVKSNINEGSEFIVIF